MLLLCGFRIAARSPPVNPSGFQASATDKRVRNIHRPSKSARSENVSFPFLSLGGAEGVSARKHRNGFMAQYLGGVYKPLYKQPRRGAILVRSPVVRGALHCRAQCGGPLRSGNAANAFSKLPHAASLCAFAEMPQPFLPRHSRVF
jgi:hypothetical protein